MPEPLLVVRGGVVRGTNDAAEELLGPAVGLRCDRAVRARDAGGPVCTATCALAVERADQPRVRVRGAWWRLVCTRVADEVVVQLLPAAPDAAAALTPREREIVEWIARGLTTRQIAKRLEVSPGTVRTHVERVLRKLGARTRAEVVARLER